MINRHSLLRVPFDKLPNNLSKDVLLPFKERAVTSIPHSLAWIGSAWKITRNDEGKFSFYKSLQSLLEQQRQGQLLYEGTPVDLEWLQGFILYLTHSPRGEILHTRQKQSDSSGCRYAASIPLILSAFKQYRNIGYEEWDWNEAFSEDLKVEKSVRAWVDRDFLDVVKYRYSDRVEFSTEDLLAFRDYTNAKGRALTAVTTVYSNDPDFKVLPRLVKLMLLQLWIYHPTIRHPLAVTNLDNFDEPVPPLATSDIVQDSLPWDVGSSGTVERKKTLKNRLASAGDIPWDV